MKNVFRYLAISMAILFALGSPALAEEVEPIGDSIITFLENADQPISPYAALTKNPSVKLIDKVSEAVFTSDPARIETALTKISSQPPVDLDDFQQTLSFSKQIFEIYQTLAATGQDDSYIERRNTALIKFFDDFAYDDNWYLQSVAYSLGAFIHISDNRLLIAGEQIDKAMHVIPTELSSEVTDARLLASEVAMILHGLQGNPEFLLDAAMVLQKSKLEVGETINRYELMTNFVYALNRARDYENASKVATLLVDEPRSEDTVFGVAEVYMAETFNETGDYSNARILAEKALAGSTHPVVDGRGNRELLVAQAGLGDIKAARSLMRERGWNYSAKEFLETVESQTLLHAEALIAMHKGESAYALSLMKRRADLLVGRVQSVNSASMTDMLSNLENTRERQAERENALKREAEMRAVQLEQKTNLNRLLWVLIGFLTIAFNFLLAFLRYREKLNVKVQGLQEDALSAEKMKTEFLGIINHELRTPLNGIIGISDAMIHHAPTQIMREQATAVQESGQLLFDLLDSLITMSTIESDRLTLDAESGKLSKTIANEAAEWTNAAQDKGIEFTAFIGTELDDPVVTDHKRIRQCLRYLLSNAVRFTHAGRVHLHATGAQDSDGMMAVTIIVADTGQGISETVQKRLFKPFLQADATMTRKYGGAGLSLAITRKLAEMMGGDVTVKSREGRGSEFTFTAKLPMAEVAQADIDDTELAQSVSGMAEADTPEAIIDLMLEQQLPAAASAQQPRFKAVG